MSFTDYVEANRQSKKNRPNQDIVERWQQRVVRANMHTQGEVGAKQYLSLYGKSVGSAKCIMFARYAEEQGYPEFAKVMWEKAFAIDDPERARSYFSQKADEALDGLLVSTKKLIEITKGKPQEAQGEVLGDNPYSDTTPIIDIEITPSHRQALDRLNAVAYQNPFPADMQPGQLVDAQPTDAIRDREWYISNPAYASQPKKDGNKVEIWGTPEKGFYQSRQLKVNSAPSMAVDNAIRTVAGEVGGFILSCEIFYLDVELKEHMTGATCFARNAQLGMPDTSPLMQIAPFSCMFLNGEKISRKLDQVMAANELAGRLSQVCENFVVLEWADAEEEKRSLAEKQKAEGREGEVYWMRDMPYRPGKVTSSRDPFFDGYVRHKNYIGTQVYLITGVEPSRADGHTIGGFTISELDGTPRGSVGTGYGRTDQVEILRRHNANPGKVKVLVNAQTLTVYGVLRHAAFKGFPEEE